MIRDVNLLNSGKANRLVPKSEVLSADKSKEAVQNAESRGKGSREE